MNWLDDELRRRNQLTQDHWVQFAAHRQRVTGLLLEACRAATDRLGVLGAGNCNDLELRLLLEHFAEIHLADADPQALSFAIQQQRLAASDRLHINHGQDLTGILDSLADLGSPVNDREGPVYELLARLRRPPVPLPTRDLDVVASTCVLSQLIDAVSLALGRSEPLLHELALEVRNQHIGLMLSVLRPGGRGVLISDFVSSDSCAELSRVSLEELPSRARHWIECQNFFSGTNPFAAKRYLMEACALPVCRERVEVIRPWKWSLGRRMYAVSAVRFERADGHCGSEPLSG